MSQAQAIAAKKRAGRGKYATAMLNLLKAYVADDPCARNDWRFEEAKRLIELCEKSGSK